MSIRILAVCIHNSARSQMTEEFIRKIGGPHVDVMSAGIEPGSINPAVAALLQEEGIDISQKETRSVADLHRAGEHFDYVIAVCDPDAAERCPIFPAEKQRLHWPFPDPSRISGTMEEQVEGIRPIRDEIYEKVTDFLRDIDVK